MGAILIFYLFISSLIADLIRIIQKYLIKEKHLNFIPIIHKKGLLAIIISPDYFPGLHAVLQRQDRNHGSVLHNYFYHHYSW